MADKLKTHEFHQPEPDYLTMNKDELSQALHKLSLSESYMIDRITRSMASCYMIIPPTWIKYSTTCDGCGGECDMFYKTYDNDPPQIIPKYKALAKKFQDLGYQADVRCYCEKCITNFLFISSQSCLLPGLMHCLGTPANSRCHLLYGRTSRIR